MYMDLDFGPPPELCIYEVSGQNGKMDLDSSPTDSVGLELVLQICFGGREDVLGFFWDCFCLDLLGLWELFHILFLDLLGLWSQCPA